MLGLFSYARLSGQPTVTATLSIYGETRIVAYGVHRTSADCVSAVPAGPSAQYGGDLDAAWWKYGLVFDYCKSNGGDVPSGFSDPDSGVTFTLEGGGSLGPLHQRGPASTARPCQDCFGQADMGPPEGAFNVSSFPVREAIDQAVAQDAGLQAYLSSHGAARLSLSAQTENGSASIAPIPQGHEASMSRSLWFSDASSGYKVTVRKQVLPLGITNYSVTESGPAPARPSNATGPQLTLAAGLGIAVDLLKKVPFQTVAVDGHLTAGSISVPLPAGYLYDYAFGGAPGPDPVKVVPKVTVLSTDGSVFSAFCDPGDLSNFILG